MLENIRNKIESLKKEEIITRDQIQQLCKELPQTNILLTWATRIGKMRGGLSCIRGEKTLIVSPLNTINKAWEETIQEHFPHLDYKIICYASLHKELDEYDVVILDEVHHLTTRLFNSIKDWKCRWIGLSGTLPYEQKLRWIKLTGDFFEWEISLQQGIDWGIIPPPRIVCIGLNLRNKQRLHLYVKGKNAKKKNEVISFPYRWNSITNPKVNTLIQCTEHEWNLLCEEDIEWWKSLEENPDSQVPSTVINNKINYLGNQRKKFFSRLKNRYIKKVVEEFELENKRVVFFCNDIPQAEFVDEDFAIHSKKKNYELIEQFNEGEINKLVSIRVLNEGVNLYNVDAGVIIQASNSDIMAQQQAARTLISELPFVVLIYFKNTRDEEYVNKFVLNFKKEYIQWLNR